LTTYFQKIAVTPEEVTSNLSAGQTIEHIAAVVVPVMGGIVWERFGSQAPFLVGVGIALVSLSLTQFMRPVAERVAVVATAGD
jgi:predicted MFS family arabinose efflux permease